MFKSLYIKGFCLSAVVFIAALSTSLSAIQQEKVFFGSLHSHTSLSDGLGTPREAYTHARNAAKMDFLALTEHNHKDAIGTDGIGIGKTPSLYKGPGANSLISVANSMTQNGQFVALYGQEFSSISTGNHTNVFDIGEVITSGNGRFDQLLTFLDTNKDSTGKPAIIMFNHPKNTLEVVPKEYGNDDFGGVENFVAKMGAQARMIQLINGPALQPGINLNLPSPDVDAYRKYLALGFKLAPTADQDNHNKNWGTSTSARTGVIATQLTKAALLDAMRKRHVYATEDKNLKVIIKVSGHLCGDVISPLPPASELSIQYSISDADEPNADYAVRVFRGAVGQPAQVVSSVPLPAGGGTGNIEDVAFSGEAQYFFFEVVQFNEGGQEDHAWTSPVWFQTQPEGGGTVSGDPPPTGGTADFIASRRSNTFHVSLTCLDAQRIKTENRVTGEEARQGRHLHAGCPRTTGGQ